MLTSGTADNWGPALTPDGEVVVFVRETGERSDIVVRPTKGGAERSLTHQRSGSSPGRLRISRDGRRVASINDKELGGGERSVLVVDISTGRTTELPAAHDVFSVAWSPDGQTLATAGYDTVNQVVVVELGDSSEVAVRLQCDTACSLWTSSLAFSPDGTRIALTDELGKGLWIATLPDGHATRITDEAVVVLNWTENWIYFTRHETAASGKRYPVIYRIAPAGGTPQLYARLPEDCARWDVSLSLDASTAVCSVEDSKPDVHIVENFDAGR
jgi:dipeptidyl aminopeptidase/acylaminoacyl peptidase